MTDSERAYLRTKAGDFRAANITPMIKAETLMELIDEVGMWKKLALSLEADRNRERAKSAKLARFASIVYGRSVHDRAHYEGDGDPGCYNGCQACMAAEVLR